MIVLKNIFAPLEKLEKCFIELRGQEEAFVDGCVKLLVYGREESIWRSSETSGYASAAKR